MEQSLEAEFTAFVTELGSALLRTAHALTGGRRTAEDLVQGAPSAGCPPISRGRSPAGIPRPPVVEVEPDAASAASRGENVHFLQNGQILSLTDREAVLYDPTGKLLQTQTLPYDLRERELSIGRP